MRRAVRYDLIVKYINRGQRQYAVVAGLAVCRDTFCCIFKIDDDDDEMTDAQKEWTISTPPHTWLLVIITRAISFFSFAEGKKQVWRRQYNEIQKDTLYAASIYADWRASLIDADLIDC